MTHTLQVLVFGGRAFAMLEDRAGELHAIVLERDRDAETLAFALWGSRYRIDRVVLPAGLTPGPFVMGALERPKTVDEVVPTPPGFLDWWKRVSSGERVQPKESELGDLNDEPPAPKLRPRRTTTDRRARYEVDGSEYVRVETGASSEEDAA